MNKRIFITGGAGYVGSLLVPYLLKKGTVLQCMTSCISQMNFPKNNKKLKIVRGDIRDKKLEEEVENTMFLLT